MTVEFVLPPNAERGRRGGVRWTERQLRTWRNLMIRFAASTKKMESLVGHLPYRRLYRTFSLSLLPFSLFLLPSVLPWFSWTFYAVLQRRYPKAPDNQPLHNSKAWSKRRAHSLPSRRVIRLHDRICNDFPPKEVTSSSQRACTLIPKHNKIFRLRCNDKVLAIASDRDGSPRPLKRTVDHIRCFRHATLPNLTRFLLMTQSIQRR